LGGVDSWATAWSTTGWNTTITDQSQIEVNITTWDVANPQDFIDAVSEELAQRIQDTRKQNL
jgi:hypothetical protein